MFIRKMKVDDLETLLEMSMAEGWSSDMFEFNLIQGKNPEGCFVCIEDDRVIGGVMTFRFFGSGWIGNLVVRRKYRLRGYGKALLRRAVRHLSDLPTIFLCASPMAVGLYNEFGFRKISNVNRWECRGVAPFLPDGGRDLEYLLSLDRSFWRDDRSLMLVPVLEKGTFTVKDGGGLGFRWVRDHWTITPWEAVSKESAAALLYDSLVEEGTGRILVDVFSQNTFAWDILDSLGFAVVNRSAFMCRGELPDISFQNIFGFASMGSMG